MLNVIYGLVQSVFGFFLSVAGIILNYAINTFVIGFGTQFQDAGIGFVVNQSWAALRDIFNLVFIFGLVAIGFKMILRVNDSNSKRWLVMLILAALLVNFSLFITKFVIDFSNIVAVEIINEGLAGPDPVFRTQTNNSSRVDISMSMSEAMRLPTINNNSPQTINTINNSLTNEEIEGRAGWGLIFGTMIVYIVATFVFLAAAILLIIRAAVLIILMIVSPFLFIGMVFPSLQSSATKLWKMLFSRAFFAPIYILFLYITLTLTDRFVTAVSTGNNGPNIGGAMAGLTEQTISNTFGPFLIIVVLLMISLVAAQKIGAEGGGHAVSMGKSTMNYGRKKVVGGAATQTAGRGARYASGVAGRNLSRGLNRLQQGDGAIARAARSNAVQGSIGGAATAMQNKKYGLKRTREEERKMRNETEERANRARNHTNNNQPPIDDTSTPAQITARQEGRRAQQAEVNDMSTEEILNRARLNPQEVMGAEFASLLSDAQMNTISESGILTDAQSTQMRNNRNEGAFADITAVLASREATEENLTEAMAALDRTMSTISNERLQRMNPATLSNHAVASRMTDEQFDSVRQSGRVDAAGVTAIRNARRDSRITIVQNGSLANPASPGGADPVFQDRQRRALFRNAQAAGRMDVGVLRRPGSAPYLTPRIAEEFLNNNPTDADIAAVRANITAEARRAGAPAGYADTFRDWTTRTVAGQRFGLTL